MQCDRRLTAKCGHTKTDGKCLLCGFLLTVAFDVMPDQTGKIEVCFLPVGASKRAEVSSLFKIFSKHEWKTMKKVRNIANNGEKCIFAFNRTIGNQVD